MRIGLAGQTAFMTLCCCLALSQTEDATVQERLAKHAEVFKRIDRFWLGSRSPSGPVPGSVPDAEYLHLAFDDLVHGNVGLPGEN
jgi:hypothetical protein